MKRLFSIRALVTSLGSLTAAAVFPQVPGDVAAPAAATIDVQSFRVSGNTLLDPAVVDATLAAFKGLRTIADLRLAAERLQRRYAQAGFGGVVAYLPPQAAEAGVVAITVVEGKVVSIDVRGADHFDAGDIRASVPELMIGVTPRVRRIDSQIEIANENPAKRVQVLLKPGPHAGEIAAELAVQDKPLQTTTFGIDDTGNSRTGHYRAGLTWQYANLSGRDDVLTAQYQTSPTQVSHVTVLSAAYRLPLPRWLAVIDAYAAYSDVDAGTSATAAGNVNINGRGNLSGVRSTWYLPRVGEADQRLAFGIDRRAYINRCAVDGLPSAACGPAGADVTVTPLSIEYTVRSDGPLAWSTNLGLLHNVPLGGGPSSDAAFAAQRPGAKPAYTTVRGAGSATITFAEAWQLRGRLGLQWSGDALVSGEQFGIGGVNSVRGYEEREQTGDRGLLASIELTGPEMLTRTRPSSPSLRLFGFGDAGTVSNGLGTPCRETDLRCTLASVGLGMAFERDRLQARLAVAAALRDAAITRKGNARAHFSAIYSF